MIGSRPIKILNQAHLMSGFLSRKGQGASSTWRHAAGKSAIFIGGVGLGGTGEGLGCRIASLNQ
jgi:hypothetical protein